MPTTSSPNPARPLGITLGDCNGIGPEIALQAARAAARQKGMPPLLLIGPRAIWEAAATCCGLPCPPAVAAPEACDKRLATWDACPGHPAPRIQPGKIRVDAARTAHAQLCAATEAAKAGRLGGIVTAPIGKDAFQRAGLPGPGHTEILADLCGTKRYAMMLFGSRIRVVLATRHIPLKDVAKKLTQEEIILATRLLHEALPWMGFSAARIGVCGLNPHAGDGGALGDEEQRLIAPAIRACRKRGIHASGPFAADALFHEHYTGQYDAVVAMYHDQGLAPLKMISFSEGVNLTLGLPIVRTSPDHGTAYGIAWQNRADPASMRSAIRWAAQLAAQTNPWKTTER